MKNVIERIQDNDTEYDPIASACHSLQISPKAVQTIYNYINFDGYYGPTSSHLSICVKCGEFGGECECQARFKVDGLQEGLEVLASVQGEISDYYYEFECGDPECEDCPETYREFVASSDDIARAAFSTIIEIYGTTPAGVAQPRF